MDHKLNQKHKEVIECLKHNKWSDQILKLHPKMKEIIQKDKDANSRFLCKICKIHNSSLKSQNVRSLVSHFFSGNHSKHMKKENMGDILEEICKIFNEDYNIPLNQETISSQPHSSSIRQEGNVEKESNDDTWLKFELTKFIVSNRLPYSIIEKLLDLIKSLVLNYEQEVLLGCNASRKLVTDISRDCIGRSLQESILEDLITSPFSLMIDKGSDNYGKAFLTVCVKYLDKNNLKQPLTKLLSIIETGEKTTSEELYKLIKERILTKHELIPKNLMAIATDGEPSMTGRHQGLISRVENDYDHLLAVRDLCHIYNLICQKALEEYKGEVVKMVKYIASHFSKSPLRVAMLDRIQKENGRGNFLDVLPYKEKRWLSLTLSLERILKIWDDLKVYFTEVSNEGLNYFTEENQSHARCLFILLSQLTHYNKEFQRTEMNYHEVITTTKESFTVFAREVLPKEYDKLPFKQLYEISFQSEYQPKILNLVQFKERFNEDYNGAVSETLSPETKDKFSKLFETLF